jgi:hypothetical protein
MSHASGTNLTEVAVPQSDLPNLDARLRPLPCTSKPARQDQATLPRQLLGKRVLDTEAQRLCRLITRRAIENKPLSSATPPARIPHASRTRQLRSY